MDKFLSVILYNTLTAPGKLTAAAVAAVVVDEPQLETKTVTLTNSNTIFKAFIYFSLNSEHDFIL